MTGLTADLPTSRKVGRLPVKIPFNRCMVVVGGSATNFANTEAPPCVTSHASRRMLLSKVRVRLHIKFCGRNQMLRAVS